MNDVLCGRLAGQFVTAAYLFIDCEAPLLRYCAAGHPILRSTRSADRIDRLEQNGLMLGVLEGQAYSELEEPLRANDALSSTRTAPSR